MILLNLCNEEDFKRAKRILQGDVGAHAGDRVICFCIDPPPAANVRPQDLLLQPPRSTSLARQQIANRSALILVDELRNCARSLDVRFLACNLPKDVNNKLLQVARKESEKRSPKFTLSILGPGDSFPIIAAATDIVVNTPPPPSKAAQFASPANLIAPIPSVTPRKLVASIPSVTPATRIVVPVQTVTSVVERPLEQSPTHTRSLSRSSNNKRVKTPKQAPETLPADVLQLQRDYAVVLDVRNALIEFQSKRDELVNTEREQLKQVEHRCAQLFPKQSLDNVVHELNEKRQELERFEHLLGRDGAPTAEQHLWIKSRNDARRIIISICQGLQQLAPICVERVELKQNIESARLEAQHCVAVINAPPQLPSEPSSLWNLFIHYLYVFAFTLQGMFGWKLFDLPHQPVGLIRTSESHYLEFDQDELERLKFTLAKSMSCNQFVEAKQCLRQIISLCQFNDESDFACLLLQATEENAKLAEYRPLFARAAQYFVHHQELVRQLVSAHEMLGKIPGLKREYLLAEQMGTDCAKWEDMYSEIHSKIQKIANPAFPELVNRPLLEWKSVTRVGNMEEEEEDVGFRRTLEKNHALLAEELSEYVRGDGLHEPRLAALGRTNTGANTRVFGAASETNNDLYVFKRFAHNSNAKEEIKHMRAALEMSRRISHQSILRCLGGLIDNDNACLQFLYMPGGDLTQWCKESPRSMLHKDNVLCGVIGAIAELHKNKIVHRNINPSNVVMDGNAIPKLTGFDLAMEVGTVGNPTAPGLKTKSMFTAPDAMQDQKAISMAMQDQNAISMALQSQDLYSFAATYVAVLGFDCAPPPSPLIALLDAKRDSFTRGEVYEVMKKCLSNKHKLRPETEKVYRTLALRQCVIDDLCYGKELFFCQGVTCPQGMHFYCEADFDAFVKSECTKPLAERNADSRICCTECELPPKDFPISALYKHMELINKAKEEVFKDNAKQDNERQLILMREEERERVRREEEERKQGLVASLCRRVADEIDEHILVSRCGKCKAGFDAFTGCCALTCECGARFCAFCFQVDVDSHQSHQHVLQCNENPNRGDYFATKVEYQTQQRRRKARLVRDYLNKLPSDQRQQVQDNPAIAQIMRELGLN